MRMYMLNYTQSWYQVVNSEFYNISFLRHKLKIDYYEYAKGNYYFE